MIFFEEALLRLKQQLKVTEDRHVAAALGMNGKAFTARKRRNSFPETELYALVAKRPDLHLDVHYVLTGITGAAQASLDAKEGRIARAADAGMGFDEIRAMERATNPAHVDAIVKLLSACSASELSAVRTLLSSIVGSREAPGVTQSKASAAKPAVATKAGAKPKPAPKRAAQARAAPHSVQQNFHAPIEGDVVGRDKIVPPSSTTREKTRNERR